MRAGLFCLPASILTALALAACGIAVEEPPLEPTPTPTLVRPGTPPSLIPTPAPETAEATPACPDPYPGGAPPLPEGQERDPDEPIRLQPQPDVAPPDPYEPLLLTTDTELEELLRDALGEDIDSFAVAVKNLDDGSGAAINADRPFYAASLFKVWVMYEVFRQQSLGLLSFDEEYIVSDYYESFGLGPRLTSACETITVRRALDAMMSVSDNAAAVLLLDRVGPANVNASLAALGLTASGVFQDELPTSAADMALILEAIARGQPLDADASRAMIDLLASETIHDRLPALLPEGTQVAHKTANWENATHDAGIVYSPAADYIIAVLSDRGYDDYPGDAIAALSRLVYDYYNPGDLPARH
jgi:beta-lactamase class A